MRDIDVAQKGHNPMFLNRVVGNVLHILNDDQKKLFLNLADEQAPKMESLARMRLPLIKAFCRELNGDIPKGSSGLDKAAVIRYVGDIFAFDAELSYRRAETFGKIATSLTPTQKEYLGNMKFGDFNSWPALDERDRIKEKGKSKLFNVAYMTFASEFFSWYAGSIEADTYFCPERHGTYFGGFYMKDMPAMGKRDYDISTSVTGDSGKTFLETLNPAQRKYITGIIESQKKALAAITDVRKNISGELRKFLKGETSDKNKIIEMGRHYGELDGEMSWYYATAFAKVKQTLTPEQSATLEKLRNLEGYKSAPYYIYSQAMKDAPVIPDTDMFFFKPRAGDKK
jgi:Spy/CpxP family protein refolding chaperone